MSSPLTISAQQARRFVVSHHFLTGGAGDGAEGVMRVFERIKCLQFDPLPVAGRNHDIALQARVRGYTPDTGDTLLYKDRRLLDAWDKKVGIILASDWPGFHRMHAMVREKLEAPDGDIYPALEKVRAHIKKNGATTAKDLNISGEAEWSLGFGNWGSPNLGRVAMEAMLLWGELVIANKNGGRKAYDFADKLLPEEILNRPDPNPTDGAFAEWRVLRRAASVGLIWKAQSLAWPPPPELTTQSRNAAIERLLKNGSFTLINVEGVRPPLIVRSEDWDRYESEGYNPDGRLRFIAPLDNFMWDKPMIRALFGMDYHWEVYDPPKNRKFGYYVLPILAGDELVGRVEPYYKKGDAAMRVKGLWWEDGVKPRRFGRKVIRRALEDYARFLGADGYILDDAAKENL